MDREIMAGIMVVAAIGLLLSITPDLDDAKREARRDARDGREKTFQVDKGSVYSDKELAPYEKTGKQIERDIEAGYRPPGVGETESDAQARVLANCRAGFTDEVAPGDGSETYTCDELEQKASEEE